jgi:hypothetical protein
LKQLESFYVNAKRFSLRRAMQKTYKLQIITVSDFINEK